VNGRMVKVLSTLAVASATSMMTPQQAGAWPVNTTTRHNGTRVSHSRGDVKDPKWRLYDTPISSRAEIANIKALGRDDAWAAGFSVLTGSGSTPAVSPGTRAVSPKDRSLISPTYQARGSSPGDEWCQMEQGTFPTQMLRWDGKAWNQVTVPNMGRIISFDARWSRIPRLHCSVPRRRMTPGQQTGARGQLHARR
jgi:hypothetical protein